MAIKSTNDLCVGDHVHYQPPYFGPKQYENGIVKEIRPECPEAVWVVYHCGGDWYNYKQYTSAKTWLSDLKRGWRND